MIRPFFMVLAVIPEMQIILGQSDVSGYQHLKSIVCDIASYLI